MFESPEFIYQKALEKVENLRSETELRKKFPKTLWRHQWAERLRKLADRLEPDPLDILRNHRSTELTPKSD